MNASDGWLAGAKGAKPGILMPAHPRTGSAFYESKALGSAVAPAQVVGTGRSKCVTFKCYEDVVVIQEGRPRDREYKYYAPGVGGVLTEPHYKGGEQETELLLNATQLSPRGLAEISAEALKVDRHARVVARDVFRHSAAAERTL